MKLTLRTIIDNMNTTPEERKEYLNRNWGVDLDYPLEQEDLNILDNFFNWEKDDNGNVKLYKDGLPRLLKLVDEMHERNKLLIRRPKKKPIGRTKPISDPTLSGFVDMMSSVTRSMNDTVKEESSKPQSKSYSDYVQELKNDYLKNQSYYNNLFMDSTQTGLAVASLASLGLSAYTANKARNLLFNNGYSATVGGPLYTALMNKLASLSKSSKAFDIAGMIMDGIQGTSALINNNYGNAALNAGQIGATGISFLNTFSPVSKWRYIPKLIGVTSNLFEIGNNLYNTLTTKKGESK